MILREFLLNAFFMDNIKIYYQDSLHFYTKWYINWIKSKT